MPHTLQTKSEMPLSHFSQNFLEEFNCLSLKECPPWSGSIKPQYSNLLAIVYTLLDTEKIV